MRWQTLYTLSENKRFQIGHVEMYEASLKVTRQKRERKLKREAVEAAWLQLVQNRQLTIQEIQVFTKVNASYLAAIFAVMPHVTYTTRPIVLTFKRQSIEPDS